MGDMFDYLEWRGDITFSQLPPNCVDALIFSSLAYIDYDDIVSNDICEGVLICDVAKQMMELDDLSRRVRVKKDLELLSAAAETDRFQKVRMCFYQNIFIPDEDTQFSAVTFLLDDNSAFLTFRGTNKTLVGWKEDFNMSFQDSVPSQRLAQAYVGQFAQQSSRILRISGHSKGGNLAVYAAAKSAEDVQQRIWEIYNQDGPGFRENMLGDEGYLRIVPKIYTYVPQSSIFGMLMGRKEPSMIIKSKSISVMQHDPYNWEVQGKSFIHLDEFTQDSRFVDSTFDGWLEQMSNEERNEFVDALFNLVMTPDAVRPRDIMRPKNIVTYFKTLTMDEECRKAIGTDLSKLVEAAKQTMIRMRAQTDLEE